MEKKKRRIKSDLGENFIAPDGGWGWLVCIAGGISNFSILPCLQLFGLIFRDRLLQLGLTSSQITTITNVQPAISSCTGLLNGPMFRRFSYRQVGLTGAAFVSTGIFLSSMANSFTTYIVSFSILYGFGMGISISSTSLALNTYFKDKRRRANSTIWTIAGFGPIFLPYLTTIMLKYYGVQGTVLLYSGLALHIFACALMYQPVKWHIKKIIKIPSDNNSSELLQIDKKLCEHCQQLQNKSKSFQELQYIDEPVDQRNCEMLEAGTPMLSNANDGWYGSKTSVYSRRKSSITLQRLNSNNMELSHKKISLCEKDNLNRSEQITRNMVKSQCTCAEMENLLSNDKTTNKNEQLPGEKLDKNEIDLIDEEPEKLKWYEKVAIFFDLDLLKDLTYVNLMFGSMLSTFADINFSILTPFILYDFGYTQTQIAFAMSILGTSDVIVRFLIPFISDWLKWRNITFFLGGIIGMVIGRFIIALKPSYEIILVTFVFLGCCKGIRTIFLGLILPSFIQLNRLPAASGLSLMLSGIFTLACGPFVGKLKDATSYSVTINFLNSITMITIISWTTQILYNKRQARKLEK